MARFETKRNKQLRRKERCIKELAQRVNVIREEKLFLLHQDKRGIKEESRSISRVLSRTVIPLRRTSLHAFSNLPGSSAGHANGTLFGLAPSGVYLATDCCQPCGALLPHLFTLTGTCVLRRLFSVALSVGSRLPGVTWRSALWSPDFPPSSFANKREQRLSDRLSGGKDRAATGKLQDKTVQSS